MTYNPLLTDRKLMMWEKYPYFQKKTIFCVPREGFKNTDLSMILKFVVLFVDSQCPFYKETDFTERKKLAYTWAKIDRADAAWNEIENETEYFRDILFEYFKSINSYLFEQWYSQKIQYHNLCKMARMPFEKVVETTAGNMKNVMSMMDECSKILIKTEEKLFQDPRLRDLMSDEQEKLYSEAWAEKYALQLEY